MFTERVAPCPALDVPDVKGVASSQTPYLQRRKRNATTTRAFSKRFQALAESANVSGELGGRLLRLANRLWRCAVDDRGWRCGHVLCPRCATRTAKRYGRRVVETLLKGRAPLAFITLTTPHAELQSGLACLVRTFGRLRRRRAWTRAFERGLAFIEIDLCGGGRLVWNVHLHAVVVVQGRLPSSRELGELWRTTLADEGATGGANCQLVTRRGVCHWRARG